MAGIDDGVSGGITYNTPFIDFSGTGGSAAGTNAVASNMPGELGDTSTSGTTLYLSQTAIDTINSGITDITDNIGDFQSGISAF